MEISDLNYEGSFRLTDVTQEVSRIGNGKGTIALGPDGDSLFVAGHIYDFAIAEYPIVPGSTAGTLEELPLSGLPIQDFASPPARVPTGNTQMMEQYSGMISVDGALIVNAFEYYDAADHATHTTLSVTDANDIANSPVIGWEEMAGGAHAGGWMSPVPAEWQEELGASHISGFSSGIPIRRRTSSGPSAFGVNLDPTLSQIGDAEALMNFPIEHWLDDAGMDVWNSLSAANYGFIIPGTSTYMTIGYTGGIDSGISYGVAHYFTPGKGYYANDQFDYSPYYWLWDVNDFVEVRNGNMEPHEIRPYSYGEFDIPFGTMDGSNNVQVAGGAFDADTGMLYVSIVGTDFTRSIYEYMPYIATFSIDTPAPTTPATTTTSPATEPPEPEPTTPPTTPPTTTPVIPTNPPSTSDHCMAYTDSPIYRARQNQVTVTSDQDWESVLSNAEPNTEILLADGVYNFTRDAVWMEQADLTIRSESGNRDAVILQGKGLRERGEGLMIAGPNVTIADLTIQETRNHGVSIKPEVNGTGTHMYNLEMRDIGTQFVKGSGGGVNGDGLLACSSLGYSPGVVEGDYIAAIDVFNAVDWVVRDNYIYNFMGDGSGCEVDINCGTYDTTHSAILFWQDTSNLTIERNIIVDSFRSITLGLGTPVDGAVVRNNFIYQSVPGDAGIELWDADNVLIEHNTVIVNGGYPGAIEYGGADNLTLRNNLITSPPLDRSGSRGANTNVVTEGNITNATVADLIAPGDPHLAPGSRAIGAGVSQASSCDEPHEIDDIDGELRVGQFDVGADQFSG